MFGAFRASPICSVGLLWKSPYKMSGTRKMRARLRLKSVDQVIATVHESGVTCAALGKAMELLTESEMRPKDKYSTFSRTDPGYRKSLHKVPKWTRLTLRESPHGF